MSDGVFTIAALSRKTDRAAFSCGDESLDRYFHKQASQDMRRRVASCFVASQNGETVGFYTLSSSSVKAANLPATLSQKLPRYPRIPVVLLGRLAIDLRFQRQGYGGVLLVDAARRTLRSEIAAFAMIVEAKNETAKKFYRKFGFIPFADREFSLFLPLQTFEKALGGSELRSQKRGT
jgi:GNAT superfamily N-acetyltransferase